MSTLLFTARTTSYDLPVVTRLVISPASARVSLTVVLPFVYLGMSLRKDLVTLRIDAQLPT